MCSFIDLPMCSELTRCPKTVMCSHDGNIYREMAPLDSIIQAMGRLNREREADDALMVIYETDGDHVPYSRLEWETSAKAIKGVRDSVELYKKLPDYYKDVSARNLANINKTKDLQLKMKCRDFEKVWEKVKGLLPSDIANDTVFIPDEDEYDQVRADLLDWGAGRQNDSISKDEYYQVRAELEKKRRGGRT